jgi:hypothetical protein
MILGKKYLLLFLPLLFILSVITARFIVQIRTKYSK